MHEDRVWGLEVDEHHTDKVRLLTGSADSSIKVWHDDTVEQEQMEKEQNLERLAAEQNLSRLLRENDFVEAALTAFKLNKLRDFYHVISKLVKNRNRDEELVTDPVQSIINNNQEFEKVVLQQQKNRGQNTGEQLKTSKVPSQHN